MAALKRFAPYAPVLLLFGGFCLAAALLGAHPRRAVDFHIYVTAARRFFAGTPLYPGSDGTMPFKYAPAAAWLFGPFVFLPPRLAGAVWNLGLMVALALTAFGFRRLLAEEGRPVPSPMLLCAAVLALAQPLYLELFYGQVDLWMATLLLYAALFASRQPGLAGGLFAVAMLLKPTAVLMGMYFLLRRQGRALVAAALATAVMFLPVLLQYGAEGTVQTVTDWLSTLARTTPDWVLGHNPQGLPTLLLSFAYPPFAVPDAAVLTAVNLFSVLLLAGCVWRVRGSPSALWALLCFGAAFVSPLAWRANFVLALPLLLFLLSQGGRVDRGCVAGVAVVGLLVHDAVLGPALTERVLFFRPFAVAFAACAVAAVVAEPRTVPRVLDPA